MNTTFLDISVAQFQLFLILFIRVLGILASSPVFGHRAVVNQAKVGFALVLSIALYPAVPITLAATTDLFPFVFVVIKELMLGVMVGFVARLVFIAVQFAGEVIGIDIGFGVVNIIDPLSAERTEVASLAASYQEAIVDALVDRCHKALGGYACVAVSGGVSLNSRLRERLVEMADRAGVRLLTAAPRYCADNAAMIAGLAGAGRGIWGKPGMAMDISPNMGLDLAG